MKSIHLIQHGNPEDALSLRDTAIIPEPGPKEILIKIIAASVNPIDCRMASKYGWVIFGMNKGVQLPVILGRDFAGTVVKVGDQVSSKKEGDKVWGAIDPFLKTGFEAGTHRQYIVTSEEEVSSIPSNLSFTEAASLPYVFLTTWTSICKVANISLDSLKGKKVFINGGSGGVGSMAIQLMKAVGAYVVTSCSSKNAAFAISLGADEVVAYDRAETYEVADIDLVYNLVPDPQSQKHALGTLKHTVLNEREKDLVVSMRDKYLAMLSRDDYSFDAYKRIVSDFDNELSEMARGKPTYISIVSPMMKLTDQKGFHPGMQEFVDYVLHLKASELINNGRCYHFGFFSPNIAAMELLKQLVEQEKIKPNVSHRFDIGDVVEAFKQVGTSHTRGKVVLNMHTEAL